MVSLASLIRDVEEYKASLNAQESRNLIITPDKTIIHSSSGDRIYVPSPTGQLFHNDDSFVRVVMGPYGSGKTTTAINEVVRRACSMPRWNKGRRRSKWAIVRNTSGELATTTLPSWLAWFDELGDIHKRQKPIMTYEHVFNDGFGIVELELIFIALDKDQDIAKIKSFELTGAYINEISEVPKSILAHMKGRVNRYPSKAFCPEPYWSGIIADTNPPDEDHWIHEDFEEKAIHGYKLFKQPPALIEQKDGSYVRNPHADNAKHLPDDYYTNLATGQSREFVKVFCLGMYGTVGTGQRVYTEFNSDLHAVDELDAIQGEPLYLGWDFGLTPACIVVQLSQRGQLLVLKEYVARDIGVRSFAESVVIPGLIKDFPYCKVGDSQADPAGVARDQLFEQMSCIGELNELGIETRAASTNDIEPRLASVRYFLNKNVDGKPAFVISRKGCPTLYKGFLKTYVFARIAVSGEARYKKEPDKNEASHPHDGLQYICLKLSSQNIATLKAKTFDASSLLNPVMRG